MDGKLMENIVAFFQAIPVLKYEMKTVEIGIFADCVGFNSN